jgi:hypothetical protein
MKKLTMKNFLNNHEETEKHLNLYVPLVGDVRWEDDRGNLRMKTFKAGENTYKITYLNGDIVELSMND